MTPGISQHRRGGLALLRERVVLEPGRDMAVLVGEVQVARQGVPELRDRGTRIAIVLALDGLLAEVPVAVRPDPVRGRRQSGFSTPGARTPWKGRPVCAAWSAVITISVSSSSPLAFSASTILPTCSSAFFATNGRWRISSIGPGLRSALARSSGPHMCPSLSIPPRLTIRPRHWGSFLMNWMAASADQLSPPMCAGSNPGTKRLPSSG